MKSPFWLPILLGLPFFTGCGPFAGELPSNTDARSGAAASASSAAVADAPQGVTIESSTAAADAASPVSEARPTATPAEVAGQDALGKAVTLANPRHEGRQFGAPRGSWAVDYQVQQSLSPGERYDWVVEDLSGNRVTFDVTRDLTFGGFASDKQTGTFSGTTIGLSRLKGQLKMFVERHRIVDNPRTKGEVISNIVKLN